MVIERDRLAISALAATLGVNVMHVLALTREKRRVRHPLSALAMASVMRVFMEMEHARARTDITVLIATPAMTRSVPCTAAVTALATAQN